MKKLVMTLLLAGVVSFPLAAQETPKEPKAPSVEQGHKAFEKARKEQRAKMKAAQEKMEKLVKDYNKLKDGKKKEAKRAEIAKEVTAIHEEQLKFKADQLTRFEERLTKMKADLAQENSAEGKKAWVDQKVQALAENDGDLRVLFDPRVGDGPGMGPRMGHHGPRHHFKGPHGHGNFHGGKDGKFPPPDAELPVEKPAAK